MFMEGTPEIPPLQTVDDFERETTRELAGPFKSKFRGGFVAELTKEKPRRDWLLKGALTARMLLLIVGEPGCGKSFIALDYVMNAALAAVDEKHSQTWFGRKLKPCGTVYIFAEGADDAIIRMHAWKSAKGLADLELPIYVIPMAIDMRTNDAETTDLIAEIKRCEADCRERFGVGFEIVVVDTLNKALAGGNDSKPEDVGPLLKNFTRIKDQTGAAVIAIHHMPKNAPGHDPRGHGSLKGDNDGQWFVAPARDGAPNHWSITRAKFGPSGARHEFRLRQVVLGTDEDGDALTSCVVNALAIDPSNEEAEMRDAAQASGERKPYMTADGRAILGDNITLTLKALQLASEADGDAFPAGKDGKAINIPHGRKAVTLARWTDEMVKVMPGDDKDSAKFKDKTRKARDAASAKLTNRGIIVIDGDWVWRTARRVSGVDKAERAEIPRNEPENPPGADKVDF